MIILRTLLSKFVYSAPAKSCSRSLAINQFTLRRVIIPFDCYKRDYVEPVMNEDKFNIELRKFLKKVGITSQRDIEQTVHQAIASGAIQGNESLNAKMTLTIESLNLTTEIDGTITLE